MYSSPLESGEGGFVVRTLAVYSLDLPRDPHLTSQQKRAFQAISSDSSINGVLGSFVGARRPDVPPTWVQALPNSGTNVTVARGPEAVVIPGGTVELRTGLSLRTYARGTTHATIHSDVVFRASADMRARSMLSLDDLWTLLRVPAAAVRDEIAPVVGAVLSGDDDPTLVGQSVVATPYRDDFVTYLDLAVSAPDRVAGAFDPSGVHWTATTTAEFDTADAWKHTVIRMIDRLFSDGSFLDYEPALQRLQASESPGTAASPTAP
jgi:hypothetical protein